MDTVLPLSDLSRKDRQDIWQTFWDSGRHGAIRHRGVHVIFCARKRNSRYRYWARNSNAAHAEDNLLSKLKDLGLDLDYADVTLFINYSPCSSCSQLLQDFMPTHTNMTVEIVVSALYRIQRPSCSQCFDHRQPSDYDHASNVQGLQELDQCGIVVRAFNSSEKQDWNRLRQLLEVDQLDYRDSSREKEDEDVQDDLNKLLENDSQDSQDTQDDEDSDDTTETLALIRPAPRLYEARTGIKNASTGNTISRKVNDSRAPKPVYPPVVQKRMPTPLVTGSSVAITIDDIDDESSVQGSKCCGCTIM